MHGTCLSLMHLPSFCLFIPRLHCARPTPLAALSQRPPEQRGHRRRDPVPVPVHLLEKNQGWTGQKDDAGRGNVPLPPQMRSCPGGRPREPTAHGADSHPQILRRR